jgi:hypothetical protein
MIAYCGLDCEKCGAFIATATNDDALRAKTSAEWSKAFKVDIPPESINCTGCASDGVKFHYCANMCEIRKCARGRSLSTCAACPDYGCEKIRAFHEMASEAKANLEAMRPKP